MKAFFIIVGLIVCGCQTNNEQIQDRISFQKRYSIQEDSIICQSNIPEYGVCFGLTVKNTPVHFICTSAGCYFR